MPESAISSWADRRHTDPGHISEIPVPGLPSTAHDEWTPICPQDAAVEMFSSLMSPLLLVMGPT